MSLYFITDNPGKLREFQAIIPEIKGLDMELPEIQSLDPKEIIEAKLIDALEQRGGEFIVEDTSLYFESLNGLPGPFIKWFLKSVGLEGLFKMVQAFGNTKAQAKVVIGYANGKDNMQFFEGSINGDIVEPRGSQGFGWDAIFQPKGSSKTFAEMTPEEKNSISHRHIAATKLGSYLQLNKK